MAIFLAPLPIKHAVAMLEALERGHSRFAFGSDAHDFFYEKISDTTAHETLDAYLYVSATGISNFSNSRNVELGVTIKARLCGWERADVRRGHYKGTAHRVETTADDTGVLLFWEIDNIERLPKRIPITSFRNSQSKKTYTADYAPHGPMLVALT